MERDFTSVRMATCAGKPDANGAQAAISVAIDTIV